MQTKSKAITIFTRIAAVFLRALKTPHENTYPKIATVNQLPLGGAAWYNIRTKEYYA